MDIESQILNEILSGREKRSTLQKEIIAIFQTTLISFTLNIPGPEKNKQVFVDAHQIGMKELEEEACKQNMKILYRQINSSPAGYEAFFCIDSETTEAAEVKKLTTRIEEEHQLGRIFDFDVFDKDGKQLSRTQLGLPSRKCLLCDEKAVLCCRSRKHSIDELLSRIYEIISNYSVLNKDPNLHRLKATIVNETFSE